MSGFGEFGGTCAPRTNAITETAPASIAVFMAGTLALLRVYVKPNSAAAGWCGSCDRRSRDRGVRAAPGRPGTGRPHDSRDFRVHEDPGRGARSDRTRRVCVTPGRVLYTGLPADLRLPPRSPSAGD